MKTTTRRAKVCCSDCGSSRTNFDCLACCNRLEKRPAQLKSEERRHAANAPALPILRMAWAGSSDVAVEPAGHGKGYVNMTGLVVSETSGT